jgi:hypothetical protein
MKHRFVASVSIGVAGLMPLAMTTTASDGVGGPSVTPSHVEAVIFPGGSVEVQKTVVTPEIPTKVEVRLLQDETGSFGDDISNLQNPPTIFDGVRAGSADSQFAVASFRDYAVSPTVNLVSGSTSSARR